MHHVNAQGVDERMINVHYYMSDVNRIRVVINIGQKNNPALF